MAISILMIYSSYSYSCGVMHGVFYLAMVMHADRDVDAKFLIVMQNYH